MSLADDINLDYGGKRFFAPAATSSSIRNTYNLHAVFVDRLQGNHSVYIKRENRWFRFEDELVDQVDEDEALRPHQSLSPIDLNTSNDGAGCVTHRRRLLYGLGLDLCSKRRQGSDHVGNGTR